ncbi:MAG: hypothetical protein R3A80_11995 [Bdellovibrionota bacterium]
MKALKNYALISCFDKSGLDQLAPTLIEKGFELLATGGSYEYLKKLSLPVTEVSEMTGKAEIFGGRVKTLQYEILGGILLRQNQDEAEWPHDFRIGAVVCNFYPFQEKAKNITEMKELVEWIDIGGPTMVRSSAKNYHHVYCLTHPKQYSWLKANPFENELELREQLALDAFDLIFDLDRRISFELHSRLRKTLRYGENPHQKAVFLSHKNHETLGEISFNNLRDAEGALKFVAPFSGAAACVVKHGTLCGAAASLVEDLDACFEEAWEGDTVSRFGGIVAFNRTPTQAILDTLSKKFVEVIVLPKNADSKAWAESFFKARPKSKVFLYDKEQLAAWNLETFSSTLGTLIQEKDQTKFQEDQKSFEGLEKFFATWTAACSKSNAVTLVGNTEDKKLFFLAGAGQGQPNRVECLEKLAIPRAQDFCKRRNYSMTSLICSSDAFFPFDDILHVMAKAEIKKVMQPGGSKNDPLVMETAKKLNIEISLTGERHFWH